jgi:hypothetical protein
LEITKRKINLMHFQANLTFEMQFQKQKTNCVGEKGTAEP